MAIEKDMPDGQVLEISFMLHIKRSGNYLFYFIKFRIRKVESSGRMGMPLKRFLVKKYLSNFLFFFKEIECKFSKNAVL